MDRRHRPPAYPDVQTFTDRDEAAAAYDALISAEHVPGAPEPGAVYMARVERQTTIDVEY